MIQLTPLRSNSRDDVKLTSLQELDVWVDEFDGTDRIYGIHELEDCERVRTIGDGLAQKTCSETEVVSTITILHHRRVFRPEDEPSTDSPVADQVMQALRESGYPLRGVGCFCDEESMVLRGGVTRYFYAQMALEIARQFAGDRRIDVQISTIPRKDWKHASVDARG